MQGLSVTGRSHFLQHYSRTFVKPQTRLCSAAGEQENALAKATMLLRQLQEVFLCQTFAA